MNDADKRINVEKTTYGTSEGEKEILTDNIPSWKFWKKRRYVVAILAFFGFFNVYALRVNLSIGIVAMTENKSMILENGTEIYYQEFDWDSKLQGWILGSFFYGYITTQLAGGWLAARVGGHRVFGIGIAVTALLTLVTPPLAKMSVNVLIFIRVVEGIFEGVTYPCIHAVWSRWAPPLERSRMAMLAFSGSYMGTVIAMPVCGMLASYVGWQSIFYVFGAVGLIWFAIWMIVVKESPSMDPHISEGELKYLKQTIGAMSEHQVRITHPWKAMLTSMPVWAIVASHVSENWGFYTLLTQLPTYMKDALGFELKDAGFLSALPYLAMAITSQFSGHLADRLQERGILTTTQVRKVFNCGAFLAQTVFMMSAAYWMSAVGSLLCLTMAVGLGAFAWSGFSVNHLDIAPQHASVIMGIGNTFATLPGIISPVITGYIVTNKSVEQWRAVFFISASIYLVGCIIYGVFASGERQPWALDPPPEETKNGDVTSEVPAVKSKGVENASFESEYL